MSKPNYTNDKAVSSKDEDNFSRWPFAERIGQIIAEREEPGCITIGLYGRWGDGKTSVLNFIETSLQDNEGIILVKFNPWLFCDKESLLKGYFEVLAKALDTGLFTEAEKRNETIKQLSPMVASLFGARGAEKTIGALLSGPDIHELRDRIEDKLKAAKKRVLVIIDDVDRLEKSEIQAIFKLVKLTADFDYTAYILAFDKGVVSASLQERYSGTNGKAGEEFLEKIIQIPLHLPIIPESDLRQFCFDGVNIALSSSGIDLTETDVQEYVRDFTLAFTPNLSTPRKAKLYGNMLLFSLPLLKDEVKAVDLMMLEGIRIFSPELYKTIKSNKTLFTELFIHGAHVNNDPEKEEIKGLIDAALKSDETKNVDGYIHMLRHMFPKLESVYGNMLYDNDGSWVKKWHAAQRVCAAGYFDRYFTYSIPQGDVSDRDIASIIVGPDADGGINFQGVITQNNAKKVIEKLRYRADSISADRLKTLSLEICLYAEQYPNPDEFYEFLNPFTQAAMLISNLIQNLPKGERIDHAIQCITQSSTAPFRVEIFRWLRKEDDEKPERDAFSKEEIAQIGDIITDIVKSDFEKTDDVTTAWNANVPHVFFLLHSRGKQDVVQKHIERAFQNDKSAVGRLLDSFCGKSWGVGSGVSRKAAFRRDQYDSVTKIFDPEFILSSIEAYLGALPEVDDEFPDYYEGNDEQITFKQFVWLYNFVQRESKWKDSQPDDGAALEEGSEDIAPAD